MKSGTPLFRFPFVSRKKHLELSEKLFELQTETIFLYERIDKKNMEIITLKNKIDEYLQEVTKINLKRNDKGQFERRAK